MLTLCKLIDSIEALRMRGRFGSKPPSYFQHLERYTSARIVVAMLPIENGEKDEKRG
jgi:hypothetical protein